MVVLLLRNKYTGSVENITVENVIKCIRSARICLAGFGVTVLVRILKEIWDSEN